jgi:hypothetical protein
VTSLFGRKGKWFYDALKRLSKNIVEVTVIDFFTKIFCRNNCLQDSLSAGKI